MFLIFFAKIHPFSETSKISADFLFAIARNVGRTKQSRRADCLAGRENVYCEGHRYIGSLFRVDLPVPMIQLIMWAPRRGAVLHEVRPYSGCGLRDGRGRAEGRENGHG